MINFEKPECQTSPINLTPQDIVADPFPHIIKQPLIRPDFYQRLKEEFPPNALFDGRSRLLGERFGFGARTGRDLYQGEPRFNNFLKTSTSWREFYDYVNSPSFVKLVFELFGSYMKQYGCRVDPSKSKLTDYKESRLNLWWRSKQAKWLGLGSQKKPNDLFVRFDIHQSKEGYSKPIHCDWPSRLVSLILYFSDADEIGMDGGELRIHEHLESKPYFNYERYPKKEGTRVIQQLRPRENLGMFFLCSNNSYHSVNAIRSIKDYRRFIYLNLSSTAENIW